MDTHIEEILCSRYPEIFPSLSGQRTLRFGLECGPGWFELIDATCQLIQEHQQATASDPVVATQVKEKFGALRLYYRGGDDFADCVVDLAERLSQSICEVCGLPGSLSHRKNWLMTRCPKHLADPHDLNISIAESPSHLSGVLSAALALFDHKGADAANWLVTPNRAFTHTPLIEAIGEKNYDQVILLIKRIEHGVGR